MNTSFPYKAVACVTLVTYCAYCCYVNSLVMSLLASVLLGSTESSVELLSKEILDVIAAILRTVTSSLDIECVLLSLFFPPFDKYHMLY